jgi:hypothetical protein
MGHDELVRASMKLRTALGLFETGVAMKRAQIRRTMADADAGEVERRVTAWLQDRPGAEHGDTVGELRTSKGR